MQTLFNFGFPDYNIIFHCFRFCRWYSMIGSNQYTYECQYANFNFYSECSATSYGVNCEYRCDTCVNRICDRFGGNCTHGCFEGFKGDHCHLTCITILVYGSGYVLFDMTICNRYIIALHEYFRILIYNTHISCY
jgi:hypothetical protein